MTGPEQSPRWLHCTRCKENSRTRWNWGTCCQQRQASSRRACLQLGYHGWILWAWNSTKRERNIIESRPNNGTRNWREELRQQSTQRAGASWKAASSPADIGRDIKGIGVKNRMELIWMHLLPYLLLFPSVYAIHFTNSPILSWETWQSSANGLWYAGRVNALTFIATDLLYFVIWIIAVKLAALTLILLASQEEVHLPMYSGSRQQIMLQWLLGLSGIIWVNWQNAKFVTISHLQEPCAWTCPNLKCDHLCGQLCSREPCNNPCLKKLGCGHACIGLCGELCPPTCHTCSDKKTQQLYRIGKVFTKSLEIGWIVQQKL